MITFKEVNEKDLSTLASIFSAIYLDTKMGENLTFETALSYIQYYYQYQPDLFICAYDENIPIGATMSTLKPYPDGIHLTGLELFVSEDYKNQNIEKKLLEAQFEIANSKYYASYIDTITYTNTPLSWYKKIGLEPVSDLIVLQGSLDTCLKKIRE